MLLACAAIAQTKPENPYYARVNTFGIFTAYSNDSSHILLGVVENRKLLDIGVSYNRRILVDRIVNWQYSGEILPVALESDPTSSETIQYTEPKVYTLTGSIGAAMISCVPTTSAYNFVEPNGTPVSYKITDFCTGRRWTIGEAISPVGMQWNFLPRRTLQPFFSGHGGYMYSTQPIPISDAGSFNFTFDLGAGIELYRSKTRSIRAEYRYHHISNHETAEENPGIDNGLFQLTYTFGR
jgi:hypothetical protein